MSGLYWKFLAMSKDIILSKYFFLFTKVFLVVIFILVIHPLISSELLYNEFLNPKIDIENHQIVYATFIDDEFFFESDSSSSHINKEKKSDLFYYILGIVILIAAGFILKQRYAQYLKQRNNSFR